MRSWHRQVGPGADTCRVDQGLPQGTVDLLWNGGVGTYVKAITETNDDVGDKANDGLRVDGCELRAKCVAEGGTLA